MNWVKSCSPLIIRKAFVKTLPGVMNWIEKVIKDTLKEYDRRDEYFPPKPGLDILDKCFVMLNVDLKKFPDVKHMLNSDFAPPLKIKNLHENFPYIRKAYIPSNKCVVVKKTYIKKAQKYVSIQKPSSAKFHALRLSRNG